MKILAKAKYLVLLATLFTSQISFLAELETYEMVNKAKIKFLLSTVDTADGVSREEAANLVEAYFLKNVGCGGYGNISETTQYWVVEVFYGVGGKRVEGFTIDKTTGEISSPIGPSYEKPEDILNTDA